MTRMPECSYKVRSAITAWDLPARVGESALTRAVARWRVVSFCISILHLKMPDGVV